MSHGAGQKLHQVTTAGEYMSATDVGPNAPKVLVVDDNPTITALAQMHFQAAGWRVVCASDGFEALASIVKHRPRVVLVDAMAPRLDGYQICALVKSNADFQDIPVIMSSSAKRGYDEERARLVGCEAHISKPFTASTLMSTVDQLCHLDD